MRHNAASFRSALFIFIYYVGIPTGRTYRCTFVKNRSAFSSKQSAVTMPTFSLQIVYKLYVCKFDYLMNINSMLPLVSGKIKTKAVFGSQHFIMASLETDIATCSFYTLYVIYPLLSHVLDQPPELNWLIKSQKGITKK